MASTTIDVIEAEWAERTLKFPSALRWVDFEDREDGTKAPPPARQLEWIDYGRKGTTHKVVYDDEYQRYVLHTFTGAKIKKHEVVVCSNAIGKLFKFWCADKSAKPATFTKTWFECYEGLLSSDVVSMVEQFQLLGAGDVKIMARKAQNMMCFINPCDFVAGEDYTIPTSLKKGPKDQKKNKSKPTRAMKRSQKTKMPAQAYTKGTQCYEDKGFGKKSTGTKQPGLLGIKVTSKTEDIASKSTIETSKVTKKADDMNSKSRIETCAVMKKTEDAVRKPTIETGKVTKKTEDIASKSTIETVTKKAPDITSKSTIGAGAVIKETGDVDSKAAIQTGNVARKTEDTASKHSPTYKENLKRPSPESVPASKSAGTGNKLAEHLDEPSDNQSEEESAPGSDDDEIDQYGNYKWDNESDEASYEEYDPQCSQKRIALMPLPAGAEQGKVEPEDYPQDYNMVTDRVGCYVTKDGEKEFFVYKPEEGWMEYYLIIRKIEPEAKRPRLRGTGQRFHANTRRADIDKATNVTAYINKNFGLDHQESR
ncbi:uncharacterized protein RAG0_16337 [Rhynchosporium agropyri]|uniref:Uncharacterized protein n=1 Tax=Rhynchosporium agropyri TaxID=914238 RepID=A0A1E1LPX4_9HELO|nr:uncharacterized protein RAG0_16337 [Rhynchosporium agropyri]